MGYLALVSEAMYVELGATYANVLVGILSAIVDNIPVMFAVLTMTPDMSLGQWLLVTLTAGVGGSLLSIGQQLVWHLWDNLKVTTLLYLTLNGFGLLLWVTAQVL
jgi:Na+/H+ antiporter NhaD/arsenite permease-like protein